MLTEAHGDFLGEQEGGCEVYGDLGLLDKVFKALLATNKYHGRSSPCNSCSTSSSKVQERSFCVVAIWEHQIFLSDGEVIQ